MRVRQETRRVVVGLAAMAVGACCSPLVAVAQKPDTIGDSTKVTEIIYRNSFFGIKLNSQQEAEAKRVIKRQFIEMIREIDSVPAGTDQSRESHQRVVHICFVRDSTVLAMLPTKADSTKYLRNSETYRPMR